MQITPQFHKPPRATAAAEPYAPQEAVRYEPSLDGTSIPAFEKSGRGKQLMTQYRAGIGKLKTFLEEHPSSRSQQSIKALDIFKSRVEGGMAGHYSTQISRLYGEGKASLDTLCTAVADHTIPLSRRMEIIENLASGLLVCSDGTTTNLIMAAQDLNLTQGLHTHAKRVWEDMLDQALRDFSQSKHKGLEHYEVSEIHFVNGYRNFLADQFGVTERSDSFVDVHTVSAHVQEAAAFVQARVNPVELVRQLAEECLSEVKERFRPHLGRPLTEETAGQLHKAYSESMEAGLQGRFGKIPAWVVISEHEPTGDEDAPYSVLEHPALLMRVIAKNLKEQGLLDKEKFEVVDTVLTDEGNRRIKRIADGDFYVKEMDKAGGVGYRGMRLSDLSPAVEWPSALLMSALTATQDPEELRSLDPAKVWNMVRNGTSATSTQWQAALMHPALKRYREASAEAEFFLLNQAAEEVDKLPEQERPQAVAQSLMAGDLALASLLVVLPMPSSWKDQNQNTLLHHAVAAGADSVVTLLASAAALQAVNARGDTPLMHAARYGQTAMVHKLLGASASIDTRNKTRDGTTPLMRAAESGNVAIMSLLLKAGAQADRRTELRYSAIFAAAKNGHAPAVERLLDAKVNSTSTDLDGLTPFMLAARNGHAEVMETLLKKEAAGDVHATKFYGENATMLAASNGHAEVIALLLRHGLAGNLERWSGESSETALTQAAANGHADVVKLLLDAGAHGSLARAERLAKSKGHPKVLHLLVEARNANKKASQSAPGTSKSTSA